VVHLLRCAMRHALRCAMRYDMAGHAGAMLCAMLHPRRSAMLCAAMLCACAITCGPYAPFLWPKALTGGATCQSIAPGLWRLVGGTL
jgi:hypothetical protein